jgi:hypothetical protein
MKFPDSLHCIPLDCCFVFRRCQLAKSWCEFSIFPRIYKRHLAWLQRMHMGDFPGAVTHRKFLQTRLESGPKEGPGHEAIEVFRRADQRRSARLGGRHPDDGRRAVGRGQRLAVSLAGWVAPDRRVGARHDCGPDRPAAWRARAGPGGLPTGSGGRESVSGPACRGSTRP